MHGSVVGFLQRTVRFEDVARQDILEVGSLNVNGSPRLNVAPFGPHTYIGVDLEAGPGVDRILNAEDILSAFGDGAFDSVFCTETLEHVEDWRKVVSGMKRVLRPNGTLFVTTRSIGFPYHPHPIDTWRYSLEDFQNIFGDMIIANLEMDPEAPGVFLKAKRPWRFVERSTDWIHLFRMKAPEPVPAPVPAPESVITLPIQVSLTKATEVGPCPAK